MAISAALTEALDAARSLRFDMDDLSDQQADADRRIEQLEAWTRKPWWRKMFSRPQED